MRKIIPKNKKGMSGGLIFVAILVIGILIAGAIVMTSGDRTSQQTIEKKQQDLESPIACADSTGILTVNAISNLATGTDPSSPTITCGLNGGEVTTSVTSGTTTFAIGTDLECLISKSDYVDKSFKFKMPCGGKTLIAPLFYSTSDNPSLTWYNDDDNAMTDDVAGGATNQTDLTAGETFTLELKMQGTAGESSGDGILIVEFPASSSGNITSISFDGKTPLSGVPSVHSAVNAGSAIYAFSVSGVEGGLVKKSPLQVTLGSTKDMSGGVLTDWYSQQEFVDDDKSIEIGIQDSDGTAKYENTLDSDFYIN